MTECVHHWLITDAVDGRFPARCSRCGAEKTYPVIVIQDWVGLTAHNRKVIERFKVSA